MSDIHERFRAARQFEPDLTPRQREILALIAAGRTNTEIAAAYDITPDGAKWHVSEIYSKLGLASREEAAAYWHWRNGIPSKLVVFLRALVPAAIPLKVAAGSGAALAAIALLAAFLLLPHNSSSFTPGDPYAASVVIDEVSQVITIQRAYADDTHRFESMSTGRGPATTALSDGAHMYLVLDRLYYTKVPIPTGQTGVERGRLLAVFSARLTGTAPATSLPALLEKLREQTGAGQPVRVVGHEQYLGRAVTVLEAGPINGETIFGEFNKLQEQVSYSILIDDESLIIMAWDSPLPNGKFLTGRVTKLDLSPDFAPDTFVFKPAPGAVEASPTPQRPPSDWPDAAGLPVPAGWLAVTAMPPGMHVLDTDSRPALAPRLTVIFGRADTARVPDDAPFLNLLQWPLPGSTPPDTSTYDTVSLTVGREAKLRELPSGHLELVIVLDQSFATVTTNELTRQQLIDWANTLQLRQ